MTGMTRARIALVMVAAAALVLAATAAARTHAGVADRDRLGVRLEGRDGAVRRAGARRGAAARQADQREGRRRRPAAADQDLRHAGQQAGDREGVRPEAARPGREHHVHDVRRRLRRTGRAGDDQPRRARGRAVHRHRPDGPEALRREGQARLQLRQRRAGRRLGDGRVRLEEGLAHGGDRDRHRDRLLQERHRGVPGPLEAARRQDRRAGDVPDPTFGGTNVQNASAGSTTSTPT